MQLRQPAFVDQIERAREHLLGLGRETGDDVGAEHDIGPQPAHLVAERDGIGARMPPLHALEDEIVAGLQRQMQMRHQPRLIGKRIEQIVIGFDRIDRRQPQPRQLGHVAQDALDQRAQARLAQVSAIAGDIDAGEHDLAIAARDQPPRLRDHFVHRQRARIAAPERDDAEGAAMVAAVLHLQEGAGVAFDAVDRVRGVRVTAMMSPTAMRSLSSAHDARIELLLVADHAIDLGHRRKRLRFGLRGAAGDDDARVRALAPDAADGLARLPHRFRRHRAGVDHHRVGDARQPRAGSLPTRRC